MKNRLHQGTRSCQELEELKRSCKDWKNFPCSTTRNHERWVRAVVTATTFFTKLLLPRVQESLAAKLECCEIHEKMWVFLETFLMSTCSTRSWWITQWFTKFGDIMGYSENRRNWDKCERRAIAIITFILFLSERKTKSLSGRKCPVFVTNHAVGIGTSIQGMTIPSYLSSKMHLQKFPDQTKFQGWIVKFRVKVFAKGRNKRKEATFLRRAEDWRMFSAEDNWILFKWRHMQFSTQCHGTPWNYVERSGRRKEISPRTSILFSPESEGTDRREKHKQSEGQSCDWCL